MGAVIESTSDILVTEEKPVNLDLLGYCSPLSVRYSMELTLEPAQILLFSPQL